MVNMFFSFAPIKVGFFRNYVISIDIYKYIENEDICIFTVR
jgi:hypothetical protein